MIGAILCSFLQQAGLRQAVDGAGAGEHECLDLVPDGRADQHAALGRIVDEVAFRIDDRFADFDVARQVNDDLRLVALEDLLHKASVADVAARQVAPAHSPLMPLFERVETERLGAGFGQRLANVASNVAGAASDQHRPANGGREQLSIPPGWTAEVGRCDSITQLSRCPITQ